MQVIRNTYPENPNMPHAEVGDEVHWEYIKGHYSLVRESDKKGLFATAPVDMNGLLRSNGKQPVLTGIIGQVKSKGWIIEVE